MATQVQFRRGTTSEHSTFTGADGEVTVDTDKNVTVVHDGTTQGGFPGATQADVDAKLGPGDPISQLTNDTGYITAAQANVQSVNSQVGAVVLDADDIDDSTTAHKFVTATQSGLIDTSIQPGDNISELNNDAAYITSVQAPVQSVNGLQGTINLSASDVGALASGDNVSSLVNDA